MILADSLDLDSCPYCGVDKPNVRAHTQYLFTKDHLGQNPRSWRVYSCARCGGLVLAGGPSVTQGYATVRDLLPEQPSVDNSIPEKARAFLLQSMASLKAPAGAVMLAGSAVDAMMKVKGFKEGNLKSRIDAAAENHLVTQEMAAWAHEVRLDANDQRHADEAAALPTEEDARRTIEFAHALGTFLFALPARVERGRAGAAKP